MKACSALSVLLCLYLATISAASSQVHLKSSLHRPLPVDENTIQLQSLSEDEFTTFSHSSKPSYGLRIKRLPKSYCDPTVNAYSGYLDVGYGGRHMFFQFFESRNDPSSDDVLMWINGGPGGSSMMGLYLELGPCLLADPLSPKISNATRWNPHSWNSNTNVFFLDQP